MSFHFSVFRSTVTKCCLKFFIKRHESETQNTNWLFKNFIKLDIELMGFSGTYGEKR